MTSKSAMNRRSSSPKILPIGFIGVLITMARVREVIAASSSSRGRSQFGGLRRTGTGTAPARRTMTG